MAGLGFDNRRGASTRARWLTAAALAALLALGALALPSAGAGAPKNEGSAADKSPHKKKKAKKSKPEPKGGARKSARASQTTCGPELATLNPGFGQFTAMIRINTLNDVNTWAGLNSNGNPISLQNDPTGGLKPRVQVQDIFLINSRFGNDAVTLQNIATKLRQNFPCNRIWSLNGLAFNAFSTGYIFSLLGAPEVGALLIDWEMLDWNVARASDPGTPAWIDTPFTAMQKRLKQRMAVLANGVAANSPGKKIGAVPFARADWQLGLMARTIDLQARRIVPGARGFQSVQTQKSCQTGGATGMTQNISQVFTQYKQGNFKKNKAKHGRKPRHKFKRLKPKTDKQFLGVQVSFTNTPTPGASDPVKSVGPTQAAQCTTAAIARGAGGILFWARPQDMASLFADPTICAIRPSPTGIC